MHFLFKVVTTSILHYSKLLNLFCTFSRIAWHDNLCIRDKTPDLLYIVIGVPVTQDIFVQQVFCNARPILAWTNHSLYFEFEVCPLCHGSLSDQQKGNKTNYKV